MSEVIWEISTTNNYTITKSIIGDTVFFFASSSFQGSRKGYIFTTGINGTGYYLDNSLV